MRRPIISDALARVINWRFLDVLVGVEALLPCGAHKLLDDVARPAGHLLRSLLDAFLPADRGKVRRGACQRRNGCEPDAFRQ